MKTIWLASLALVIVVTAASLRGAVAASGASDAEWSADTFEADVYPSMKSAARRLGAKWAAELKSALTQMPNAVALTGDGMSSPGGGMPDVVREIQDAAQSQLSGVRIRISGGSAPLSAGEIAAKVRVTTPQAAPARGTSVHGWGEVALETDGAQVQTMRVRYVNKPWADDLGAYLNSRPGDRYVVGWPAGPCVTAEQAAFEAERSAIASLIPIAQARLLERYPSSGQMERDRLNAAVATAVHTRLVSDRFLQRFNRPYGTAWRQAVLVSASMGNVDQLVNESVTTVRREQQTWARTGISIAVLVVVVYVLYLCLNAVTKGYFRWRLRMAAVIAAALFGLLLAWWFMTATLHTVHIEPRTPDGTTDATFAAPSGVSGGE